MGETESIVAAAPRMALPIAALEIPGATHEPRPVARRSRGDMLRRRDATYRRGLALADMVSIAAALALGASLIGIHRLTPLALAVLPAFVLLAKAVGLYDRDEHLLHKSTLDEVPMLFYVSTLAAFGLWLSDGAVVDGGLDRLDALVAWVALFLLLIVGRTTARRLAREVLPTERCLLLGDPQEAAYLAEKLAVSPAIDAELVGSVPLADATGERGDPVLRDGLGAALDDLFIDRVIVGTGARGRDELLYIIRKLKSLGVKVSVLPDASRVAGSSVELDHLHGVTLLGMRRFDFTRSSRVIKRIFDIVGASLGLLLASPLLAVAMVAIRLDSPGPLCFRQARVGRFGTRFEMIKLRSMVDGADQAKAELEHLNEGATGLFKIPDDPRVTRVGRVLRRFQIDELPQLINVLRGEMSLVGPRPLVPEEDQRIVGWYRRRLDVPPGITGHWQVLGSSTHITLDEMVKLDYLYVANWSLWGDVRLLIRTLGFLATRNGV
jgi:exopolysaccharide biosynthesis polyprenyl glycosylphosphotransferase